MCLKALNIGLDDEVIMPTISYHACAANVLLLNATVFCDVDENTMNIDLNSVVKCITEKTKAVIVNHYGGLQCDMDGVFAITNQLSPNSRKIHVIEDAACALGSFYKNRPCGTMGTFGCFSFDAMKMISCGEGGAICINSYDYLEKKEKLKTLRFSGMDPNVQSGLNSALEKNKHWWKINILFSSHKTVISDILAILNEQLLKLNTFMKDKRYGKFMINI